MCKPVKNLPATKWDHLDPLIPSRRQQFLADLAVADATPTPAQCDGPVRIAAPVPVVLDRHGLRDGGVQ